MAKVTGIGGLFYKVADPAATRRWYAEHLGIEECEWGASLAWNDPNGATIWSPFAASSDYFGPGSQAFMANMRVDDLDALLAQLQAAGVAVVEARQDDEYGKFGWIIDCDGLRVELWQPPG